MRRSADTPLRNDLDVKEPGPGKICRVARRARGHLRWYCGITLVKCQHGGMGPIGRMEGGEGKMAPESGNGF